MKRWVIKQNGYKDCGAACVLSIVRYYGGNANIENVRKDLNISNNGCSAFDIINTLKKYGFDSKGYNVSCDLQERKILFPCIAHIKSENGYYHFVVLLEKSKKYIKLMDPAFGIRKICVNDWKIVFTNIIITASPISVITNYKGEKNTINILLHKIMHQKILLLKLVIFSLISIFLGIIGNLYLNILLKFSGSQYILLFLLIIFLLKNVLNYITNILVNHLKLILTDDIICKFINHIYYLPYYSLKSRTVGDLVSRVIDLESVKNEVCEMVSTVLITLIMLFFTTLLLLKFPMMLNIVIIVISLIYFLFSLFFNEIIAKKIKVAINDENLYNQLLVETLTGITSIKNCDSEEYFYNKIRSRIKKYKLSSKKSNNLFLIFVLISNIIFDITLLIMNYIGVNLIKNNTLTISGLIAYNSIAFFYLENYKSFISLIPKVQYIKEVASKINEIININNDTKYICDDYKIFSLQAENINSFYYNKKLNKSISFSINTGSNMIIYGKSGVGKSSLCKALIGTLNRYSGQIKINNRNIKEYSCEYLKENISYLSQDECIFNDTIRNNILLGRNVSESKLEIVFNICRINEIVSKKNNDYDAYLLENGSNLSGGEKQRIILARHLLSDKSIYIFDEALSEVEPELMKEIINDVLRYLKKNILIYISHENYEYFNQSLILE